VHGSGEETAITVQFEVSIDACGVGGLVAICHGPARYVVDVTRGGQGEHQIEDVEEVEAERDVWM
jgi:hypothetical protein